MRKIFMLMGIILLLVLGCSSPTDPSGDAFKQIAEEHKTITIPLVTTVE